MKKVTFILASLCLSATMFAQTTTQRVMLNGKPSAFEPRIQVRETIDPTTEPKQISAEERIAQWDKQRQSLMADQQSDKRFSVTASQLKQMAKGIRSGHVKERMDSVVTRAGKNDPNGAPLAKQEFTYNEQGQPLMCINYLPDDATGEWAYMGEYGYEYDDDYRMTAAWTINGLTYGETERYEFVYEDDTNLYSTMIYYTYDNGDWMPAQMVEYTFDGNMNTTGELYSNFDAEAGEWVPAQRTTASYDELNRMTSYYQYQWDDASGDWIGINMPGKYAGEAWEYTATGADATHIVYQWTDSGWQGKSKEEYTYDEQGHNTQTEWFGWSIEEQVWKASSKIVYTLNEDGRVVRYDAYNVQEDGTYGDYYTYTTYEYSMLENGEEQTIISTYGNIGGGIELYRRTTTHHKADRSIASAATYELGERKTTAGGPMLKTQETFRFIDDEGHYLGLEDYSFTPNETNFRQGSSKELVSYDEKWRQTRNQHWRGRRTGAETWQWDAYDDWVVYPVDTYDGWTAAGYDFYEYAYASDVKTLNNGFYTNFDFTMRPENMSKWVMSSNNADFRKYKFLDTYNYVNQGTNGEEDINGNTKTYYYTQTGEVEGGWNADGMPIVIGDQAAENMKAVQAGNGEIYVGWTFYGENGYTSNMQLVDKDGYTIFGANGMAVNGTEGGQNSEIGMDVDGENNLVMSFPDGRGASSKWSTMPFAYKLSNEAGSQLWGADGVAVPSAVENNVSKGVVCAGENSFVLFADSYDYDQHTFYANRLSADGSLAWEESKALPGSMPGVMAMGDNLLEVYVQEGKPYAQLLNADLEAQWAEPLLVADVEISSLPYTGNLFNLVSDGQGGALVGFVTASYNGKYYVQHITADGKVSMQQAYCLNPEDGQSADGVKMAANGEQIALLYQSGDWSGRTLNMQVVDYSGKAVGTTKELDQSGSGFGIAAATWADNDVVLAYVNAVSWNESVQKVMRIDLTNDKVFAEQVGSGASQTSNAAVIDAEAIYFFWLSTEMDYETYIATNEVQGVRFFINDIKTAVGEENTTGIHEESTIKNEELQRGIYDLQGRKQNAMNRGLNIVRNNGEVRKVVVK